MYFLIPSLGMHRMKDYRFITVMNVGVITRMYITHFDICPCETKIFTKLEMRDTAIMHPPILSRLSSIWEYHIPTVHEWDV